MPDDRKEKNMKHLIKNLTSLLLAALLCICILPTAVIAEAAESAAPAVETGDGGYPFLRPSYEIAYPSDSTLQNAGSYQPRFTLHNPFDNGAFLSVENDHPYFYLTCGKESEIYHFDGMQTNILVPSDSIPGNPNNDPDKEYDQVFQLIYSSLEPVDRTNNKNKLYMLAGEVMRGSFNWTLTNALNEGDSITGTTELWMQLPGKVYEAEDAHFTVDTGAAYGLGYYVPGEQVTVTVEPDRGYAFKDGAKLTATGTKGGSSELTPTENENEFTFIMPTGNAVISGEMDHFGAYEIELHDPDYGVLTYPGENGDDPDFTTLVDTLTLTLNEETGLYTASKHFDVEDGINSYSNYWMNVLIDGEAYTEDGTRGHFDYKAFPIADRADMTLREYPSEEEGETYYLERYLSLFISHSGTYTFTLDPDTLAFTISYVYDDPTVTPYVYMFGFEQEHSGAYVLGDVLGAIGAKENGAPIEMELPMRDDVPTENGEEPVWAYWYYEQYNRYSSLFVVHDGVAYGSTNEAVGEVPDEGVTVQMSVTPQNQVLNVQDVDENDDPVDVGYDFYYFIGSHKLIIKRRAALPEGIEEADMEEAFPDETFRTYVLNTFDTDLDGSLSGEELASVTVIECASSNIASLAGIENFPNLEELYCDPFTFGVDGSLTDVYLSDNTKLRVVDLGCNPLESIDVTALTELEELNVGFTNLKAIDLTKNTKLRKLWADDANFGALDLSNNPELSLLDACGNPNLTAIDLTGCTALLTDYEAGERHVDLPYLNDTIHVYGGEGTTYNLAINTWTQIVSGTPCTLTVSTSGDGGTAAANMDVLPSGALYKGNTVTAVAPAVAGYTFVGWYKGGEQVCDLHGYTFVITENTELEARYEAKALQTSSDASICGHRLLLSNEIGVQFKVRLNTVESIDDCAMTFTYSDGRMTTVGEPKAETTDGVTYYWFTAYANALELADVITATLTRGEEVLAVDEYSAMMYIEKQKEDYAERTPIGDLVRALQDYGHYMRLSGWVDDNDAHTRIDAASEINTASFAEAFEKSYEDKKLADYAIVRPTVPGTKITFSLTLNSRTRVNVFSEFDGVKHTYRTDPIGPRDLGTMEDVKVDTAEGEVTVKVCPLSYAYVILSKVKESDAKKAAMVAYYNYYLAAAAYPVD